MIRLRNKKTLSPRQQTFFLSNQVLPRVAAEVSAPLAETDKITMVSTGDGPVGASKITEEVGADTGLKDFKDNIDTFCICSVCSEKAGFKITISQMLSIMGSLPTMVKEMTGVDIKQKITASA